MTAREFKPIGKQLLPHLPGFAMGRRIIFKSPVEDFLHGLCFESSSDPNCFYLWVFFLPLFVPHDAVDCTHGKRLRRNSNQGWYANDQNLVAHLIETIGCDAIPFLDSVSTLEGALNNLKADVDSDRPRVNSHILEALAYTQIKSGDYRGALESLAELKQKLEKSTTPWVVEQRARAHLIEEKLLQAPEAALQQLEAWKMESVCKLGLEKYS